MSGLDTLNAAALSGSSHGGADVPGRQIVLVVEDDESHALAVSVGLEREGFEVVSVADGSAALAAIASAQPDVVLLDVMLPGMSGIDICRRMREGGLSTPVIMVSARSEELDVVVAMEIGADDYVAKPYRLRELVSRMRAVLRRAPREPAGAGTGAGSAPGELPLPAAEPPSAVLEVGGVRLDPERHECTVRGREVQLPLKEFDLLEALLSNAGRVVTRDALIDRVWGSDYVGDTKTLDVHVKRLRSRIEADPSRPSLITTIRGLGYRFEAPRPHR